MRRISLLGAFILSFGLVACNSSVNTATPSTSNGAWVRFIQGSPDNAGVDLQMDGSVVLSGVSWNSITQYTLVFPGQHVFAAAPTGTSQTIGKSVTMTLGAPVTSNGTTILSRTTIVLGGQSGKNTAALYVFTQPTFNTNPGQATVVYGNAAPDSSAPITFGIVPTNALNATPAASASLAVGSLSGLTSIPASSSTTSVAVSAVPSGGTQSVIFPASIDGNDAGNVLPFNNNVDLNLSVFAIDAPIGTPNATGSVKLLGAFDPNN